MKFLRLCTALCLGLARQTLTLSSRALVIPGSPDTAGHGTAVRAAASKP